MRTRAWSVFAAVGAAATLLDRLRRAVPDGQTCSIGWACRDGAELPGSLLERADVALSAAERSGRDRTLLATR